MLLLLLIGYGIVTPPPPEELPYQGDAAIYDMDSPTGSVTGGTVLAPEQIYD